MLRRANDRLLALLVFADAGLTAVALFLAEQLRLVLPFGEPISPTYFMPRPIYLAALLIWPFFLRLFGVYDSRRVRTIVEELRGVVPAVLVATLVLVGFNFALGYRYVSRYLLLYFVALDLALLLDVRVVARLLLSSLTASGYAIRRLLIVGAGEVGCQVARLIAQRPWMGLALVGFVDDAADKQGCQVEGKTVLGPIESLPALVEEHQIDEVIVTLPARAHERVVQVVFSLQSHPVRVRIVPDLFELVTVRAQVEDLWGIPLIGLRDPVITGLDRATKRVFDVALGAVLLLAALPVMGLLALAIRLDSPGPVLLRLERIGENGKLFRLWKFRTMHVGAERQQRLKSKDDPRVTRLGHVLRRFSLDELPNLWNVLRGEMSLVGPRPEQPWIVAQYQPWERQRLAVPPGMTGWWQINGRSDLPLHHNVDYDLYYIQNYSPLLDLLILWKTVWVVLRGKGAY